MKQSLDEVDELFDEAGIVGSGKRAKPRVVLISKAE